MDVPRMLRGSPERQVSPLKIQVKNMQLMNRDRTVLTSMIGSSEFKYTNDLRLKKAPKLAQVESNLSSQSLSNKAPKSSSFHLIDPGDTYKVERKKKFQN